MQRWAAQWGLLALRPLLGSQPKLVLQLQHPWSPESIEFQFRPREARLLRVLRRRQLGKSTVELLGAELLVKTEKQLFGFFVHREVPSNFDWVLRS
jgi:hypothetical protein